MLAKRLLMILICSLMTATLGSQFLSASDMVAVTGLDTKNAVETVIPPEPEPVTVRDTAVAKQAISRVNTVSDAPAKMLSVANYRVTNYVGSVKEYTSIAKHLSYNAIYRYNKMIYGHNTSNLLGSLANRYVGETITITEGGITRNYRVMLIRTYRKTADGNLENDPYLMTDIANTAFGYSVALMTCAGTSYGNGDASHRLVVYANLE